MRVAIYDRRTGEVEKVLSGPRNFIWQNMSAGKGMILAPGQFDRPVVDVTASPHQVQGPPKSAE